MHARVHRRLMSRDDVGRDLVLDEGDAVSQVELALLEPLHLQDVPTCDSCRAAMAASRSRCSCCSRASCWRNSRSSSLVIATWMPGRKRLARRPAPEWTQLCRFGGRSPRTPTTSGCGGGFHQPYEQGIAAVHTKRAVEIYPVRV